MSLAESPQSFAVPLGQVRHDWARAEVGALFALPFPDLMFEAARIHRLHFDPAEVQISTLLSIKTGACPEDCAYCPQSARYKTDLKPATLLSRGGPPQGGVAKAAAPGDFAWARRGATRTTGGGAGLGHGPGRQPRDGNVRTLGMLTARQADQLEGRGRPLQPQPRHRGRVLSQDRLHANVQDRLETLDAVHDADIEVCCGGIVGMGESEEDRAGLIHQLAILNHPPGERADQPPRPGPGHTAGTARAALDGLELVRTIAAARITMPRSIVRLSAGRTEGMSDELQSLCLHAGANSIFLGDKLLHHSKRRPRPRHGPARQARPAPDGAVSLFESPTDLMLRSARSARLEAWRPSFDAVLRTAPR